MSNYEIKIKADSFDLKSMVCVQQTIIITEEQLAIIDRFANTKKDSQLETIYTLNDCEFTVGPHIFVKVMDDETLSATKEELDAIMSEERPVLNTKVLKKKP